MFLSDALSVVRTAIENSTPPVSDTSATVAFYMMISALGVAAIGVIGTVLSSWMKRKNNTENSPGIGPTPLVAIEHEAWERWFLLNGIDPRLIKNGYEKLEEVQRA